MEYPQKSFCGAIQIHYIVITPVRFVDHPYVESGSILSKILRNFCILIRKQLHISVVFPLVWQLFVFGILPKALGGRQTEIADSHLMRQRNREHKSSGKTITLLLLVESVDIRNFSPTLFSTSSESKEGAKVTENLKQNLRISPDVVASTWVQFLMSQGITTTIRTRGRPPASSRPILSFCF